MIPEPEELISSVNAAAPLVVDRRTAAKLARAGLLGPTFTSDRGGILVRRVAVDQLQERKLLVPQQHPAAFVVRLDAAVMEEGETRRVRPFKGWHEALKDNPDATAGWDRWWPIANPDAVVGQAVVALVGPIIVATRTIAAKPIPEFGRYRLPTSSDLDPEVALAYQPGRWLPLRPGAITAHLPDTRESPAWSRNELSNENAEPDDQTLAARLLRLGHQTAEPLAPGYRSESDGELYDEDGLPVSDGGQPS